MTEIGKRVRFQDGTGGRIVQQMSDGVRIRLDGPFRVENVSWTRFTTGPGAGNGTTENPYNLRTT